MFFLSIAVLAATLIAPSNARAEYRTAKMRHDSMVYRQPNDISQVLGRLREGKTIKIYFPDRNGWYAVAFSQPIQGAKYGWIHADDADVAEGGGPAPSGGGGGGGGTSGRYTKPRRSWVSVALDLHDMSPSAFQTAIGEPSSSFFSKGIGLEFGHRITNLFGLSFRGFYYSFSNATTVAAQSGGTYGASGYGMTAGADLAFVNRNGFQFSGGAGLGMSLNQAQNSSSASGYATTNILAYPLYAKVVAREFFGNGLFGVVGELGYQLQSLSAVPVQTVTQTQSTANISVGGLVISLGVALQF